MIASVSLDSGCICSKEAYVDKKTQNPVLVDYKSHELSSLANLMICEGKPNTEVLHISASIRTGSESSFVSCIRKALAAHYGTTHQVGLAGVFLIRHGSFKTHVMPSFPTKDSPGDPSWLNFYTTTVPSTVLSVLVSTDLHNDDLRLEHSHFWSHDKSTGGHYHNDTTPETVEYEGYYVPADTLWRIGKAVAPKK